MIKSIPLAALLRTLQQRDPSLVAHGPAMPIDPVAAVKAIDGSEARARTQADPPPPAALPRGEARPAAGGPAFSAAAAGAAHAARDPGPNATPREVALDHTDAGSAPQLSRTAMWLSQLSSATMPAAAALASPVPGAPKPKALLAARPSTLAQGAGVPVPELAQALARAVGESGVFYEAHLAEWAANRYPQGALAAEPQAAWAHGTIASGAMGAPPDTSLLASSDANHSLAVPDAETLPPLVYRQIATLETGEFVWHGEVWPGQAAQIAIAEERARALWLSESAKAPIDENPPHAPREHDTAAAWRTRLDLALPELGRMTIDLVLAGPRLDVRITAANKVADTRLKAAGADLVATLAARSLALSALAIRHG